jgi:formate/nitrite transporter FocA (FNT family)
VGQGARRRIPRRRLSFNLFWVLLGNLAGSLFVAYFLAVRTGVVTSEAPLRRLGDIAVGKGIEESEWQIFLPAAIFADVPGIDWGDALHNWLFAFLGNLVGAFLFVALSCWHL